MNTYFTVRTYISGLDASGGRKLYEHTHTHTHMRDNHSDDINIRSAEAHINIRKYAKPLNINKMVSFIVLLIARIARIACADRQT